MKALFIHDAPFIKYENLYYNTTFTADLWRNRYLTYFKKLTVIGRCRETADKLETGSLPLSSSENVEFNLIPYNNLVVSSVIRQPAIKKVINKCINQCDCAVVRLPSILGLMAIPLLKKADKPYLVEMVGCAWDSTWHYGWKGKPFAPILWLLNRIAVNGAPYVIYVTNEFLQRRYPTRGKSVGCSDVMLYEIDEALLKRRLLFVQNEKTAFIIGTIGGVNVRYKGQQYVIQALGKLKKSGNTRFIYQLVGGGDQSYLKSVAKKYDVVDQVEFIGSLQYDDVFTWLDSIDIYIQPSRTEGLSRALIEAMSRGLPACGAEVGGIPELLSSAFLFRNSKNEADEIVTLLLQMQSQQVREEQAKRNFEKAKTYEKEGLDAKRKEFFEKFRTEITG